MIWNKKNNLSYGCKNNSGSCRFKHWLYDPPPPKKKKNNKKTTFEQIYNRASIPALIQY